jgi:enterobactin synthetase component D / holo-[acyl-carrier protein] synthase
VFDGLLPGSARWAIGPEGAAVDDLFPEEAAAVAGAVPARVAEFAAGRVAARRALTALGVGPVPVPVGERRLPGWPPGVVGSITHCAGLAAAAVAWFDDLMSIGIDAEPAVILEEDVLATVATPAERVAIEDPLLGTVIFSAKESFYKCWSALDGAVLEFHDVEVEFDGPAFAAVPAGGERWPGRWAVRDGYVVTTAWRGRAGTPSSPGTTSSVRGGSFGAP